MSDAADKSWMASKWVRVIVFLWMFVFPIIFIALPLLEIVGDELESSWTPVWALIVWMLAPAAVSIGLKYLRGEKKDTNAVE